MLTLILGRAGSGKTAEILSLLSEKIRSRIPGNIYIVPEQYSHDAEREMAKVCPDDACLYGEVLSFSRLAGRVAAELGGLREKSLDKGGRTLAMSRAVTEAAPYLRLYSFGMNKTDFLKSLISTYDELRSAEIAMPELIRAAESVGGSTRDKINDLALIFESYDRIKEKSGLDPRDKLLRLKNSIAESSVGVSGSIYIDGFTDFTAQETRVIDELLKKGADITVTLTTPDISSTDSAFSLPSQTGRGLIALASKRGVRCELRRLSNENQRKAPELCYLEKSLMDYSAKPYAGECKAIEIYCGAGIYEELSLAASKALDLVNGGARFREIAIVSPSWDKYSATARGVFGKFNIPVNSSEKADILSKPIMAFATSALDVILNSWDRDSLTRYIKTGLSGVSRAEGDILENYLIKWNIRGLSMWKRAEGWKMHPEGYSEEMSEAERARLASVNASRQTVAEPLIFLDSGLKAAETAGEKAGAVYDFLEKAGLYEKLNEKVNELESKGKLQLADEYSQLWDILIGALEQFADILGDEPMGTDEFVRLLKLLLGEYEVSTIPSSVDSVGVGDMARMRGRGIKHLIILGAIDSAMPAHRERGELISDRERTELREAGAELPDTGEDELCRELGLIYASFTMPSQSLTLTYPAFSRRSYMVTRLLGLFGITEKTVDTSAYLAAIEPALELAASARSGERNARLARAYFETRPEVNAELTKLDIAAKMPRGRLTRMTAERLYGRNVSLSASKLDKFYSCRYSYFLKYGLRLKRRDTAGLDAPETGTFIHFVLQKTAADAEKKGGFKLVTDGELRRLAQSYCAEYAEKKLGGLEDKTGRFKYLFSRLSDDAERIVLNMARELRSSFFKPLDFELSFAPKPDGDLPPIELQGEEGKVRIVGVADRVDGWIHDDKLYLRVVDYKTGKKAFKLSDIWYGMGMQMLIYLFALQREGKDRYFKEVVPAGVLYAPARDLITRADGDMTDEELEAAKLKETKRSGLILNDPELIEAMEEGSKGRFLPVKFSKDGTPTGDSLAGMEELGALSRHITMLIARMGDELRRGELSADPYFRGQMDTACMYCDYFGACHFKAGGSDDKPRYLSSIKTPEVWEKMMREEK